MRLNETQALAVNKSDTNILVFASAGGGKTTVLINRLMKRILKDRISLDEILAMTFTDAASNEMKKRLEKAIDQAILENPDDEFLKRQKTLIVDAHISTIHSFCLDLIKEYYYVIGLKKSRQNNILDEATRQIYLRQAFDEVIYQKDYLGFLNEKLSTSLFSFEDLQTAILNIIKIAATHYDPLMWFIDKRNPEIHSFNDLKEDIKFYYLFDLKAQIKLALTYIDQIINLDNSLKDSFILKKEEWIQILNEEDYNQFEHKVKVALTSIPNIKGDKKLKPFRDKLSKVYENLAKSLLKEVKLVKEHNQSLVIEKALLECAQEVYLRFEAIKEAHDALDFNDFEHFAYQILIANDEKISKELKCRFKEIMIDEFQDTNDTQFKIASLLENNNLFLVGDIKQSIYRFRGAKPSIMQSLKEDPSFFKIHIKNNYRSKENVVEFNNHLFLKLMNIFDQSYDEEDVQIIGKASQSEDNVPIEFIFIKTDEEKKELKAKRIANEILSLHQKNEAFKDMCILVRNHNDKKEIKKALEAYNIPYFIKENEGYFNCFSMRIILSYLKLLMNPKDAYLNVAVLSSPLYELNDEQLLYIKNDYHQYTPLQKDLQRLRPLYLKNQIHDLISEILQINDFYFKHLNLQERTNIDLFISDLDRLKFNTVYDLIHFIEETETYQKESASTINEEADVVRVMTIHNSKGLEFQNVFFYSTMTNIQKERQEAVVVDFDLGIGLRFTIDEYKNTVDNISRLAILAKDNQEDLAEFVRLLYVALTRAIKRLYLVDAGKTVQLYPLNEALLFARKGFTSLIYNGMFEDELMHLSFEEAVADLVPLPKIKNQNKVFELKEYPNIIQEKIAPSSLELQDDLNFDALKGMEYGTKVHAIFEHLDFNKHYDEDVLRNDFKDIDQKTIQAVLAFINHPIIQKVKDYKLYPEFSFYLQKEEVLYHGFMDFVAIGTQELLLIDYKTDHLEDEAIFKERYTPQIKAYIESLNILFPNKKVDAYLYSTHLKTFISI